MDHQVQLLQLRILWEKEILKKLKLTPKSMVNKKYIIMFIILLKLIFYFILYKLGKRIKTGDNLNSEDLDLQNYYYHYYIL